MKKALLLLFLSAAVLFAKEFTLKTIDGKTLHMDITLITLSVKEYPDKIILLDFFGANCPPCIHEMPDLVKFQDIYQKSVQIIGVQSSSKRDDKEMALFVKKHNLNYPVINLDEATKLIVYVQDNLKWNGALPYKLLYNFYGDLSYKLYGMMNMSKLTEVLKQL